MTEHDDQAVAAPAPFRDRCACLLLWRKDSEGRDALRRTVSPRCTEHDEDEREVRR